MVRTSQCFTAEFFQLGGPGALTSVAPVFCLPLSLSVFLNLVRFEADVARARAQNFFRNLQAKFITMSFTSTFRSQAQKDQNPGKRWRRKLKG